MGGGKSGGGAKSLVADEVLGRLMQRAPIGVMARATIERALSPEAVDKLFEKTADTQYVRQLLFSSTVNLMSLVVCRIEPAVHAAYQRVADDLPVSVQALYEKLARTEPKVCSALVRHAAARLAPVIKEMGGGLPPLLPGHPVRILDGAHLASTERRVKAIRGSVAGPLPGHSIVVLDPSSMLVEETIPCEDGHAQERSLTPDILALVQPGEVWMGDRNFCTVRLLFGIVDRQAFPVIRQHATNVSWLPVGKCRGLGRIESGRVYEQEIIIWADDPTGRAIHMRRITLLLDKPTTNEEREIHILTTLPERVASGKRIARLYARRWTLENSFAEIQKMLNGEIAPLGYPRAALFGFSVALVAYNILSTIKAALRAAHGHAQVEQTVSIYYIADQARATVGGIDAATPPECWTDICETTPARFGRFLVRVAANVNLNTLRRHPRGPKTPVPKRTRFRTHTHVSTAKVLAEATGRVTP